MAIRWSALEASNILDEMDKELLKIVKPFARVRKLALQAKQIHNLPQYMEQHFSSIKWDADAAIGNGDADSQGRYKSQIQRIRGNIPEADLAKEKAKRPLLGLNGVNPW